MAKKTGMESLTDQTPQSALNRLVDEFYAGQEIGVVRLKGDGSDRRIYRYTLVSNPSKSAVGIESDNVAENDDFISMSRVFKEHDFPVPEVLRVSKDRSAYLLQDLGNSTLADKLALWRGRPNGSDKILKSYQRVIDYLIIFQRKIVPAMPDFFQDRVMDRPLLQKDIEYYRIEFLRRFGLDVFESTAIEDEVYKVLVHGLSRLETDCFVYRDFQSRNVMWLEDRPWFIDYQSGMRGTRYYDLASLLFASRAHLLPTERDELIRYYFNASDHQESWEDFLRRFYQFVIARRIRSLGSYGFLSGVKNKPEFYQKISPALIELSDILDKQADLTGLNGLRKMMQRLTEIWREERSGGGVLTRPETI